jgi:hypothetical protein
VLTIQLFTTSIEYVKTWLINEQTDNTNTKMEARERENMKWESGSVTGAAGKEIIQHIQMQEKIEYRSFDNPISSAAVSVKLWQP